MGEKKTKTTKKVSIHAGHRERLKNKFLQNDLDLFEDHEVLELLLFYPIPRRDTNPLAHELMNHFGSIHAVMDAPFSSLMKVHGVGKEVACYLKFILSFVRLYMESKNSAKLAFKTREELNDHLLLKFIGRSDEVTAILLLNPRGEIVYEGIVSKGGNNNTQINARRLSELIISHKASAIVFGHNHPNGLALPSKQDIETTKKLAVIFNSLNVKFIDHIIIAENDYVSLRECGLDELFLD